MTRLPASSEDAPLAELSNRGLSLSAALADALADVVPEPGAVRACGRGLGIDKNLAWRLVRLSEASDLAGVLSSRPGRRGWALAIAAFERVGCDPRHLQALVDANTAFDREIVDRQLDAQTVRLLAFGGLETEDGRRQILETRCDAARIAARRFGTWADALATAYLVTPADVDDRLDLRAVTMLMGLRRVGPGPDLEIHRGTNSRPDPKKIDYHSSIASHRGLGSLVPSLSSPRAIEHLVVASSPTRNSVHFRGAGPVSANGIDLTFMETLPQAAYTYARRSGEVGTYGTPALVPAAWFILDVLVERSIVWADTADAAMFTQIAGPGNRLQFFEQQRLPMAEPVECDTGVELPADLSHVRSRHRAALEHAATDGGRRLADFAVHRVAVAHPPLSTNIALRWRLPRRSKGATR